jgi:hypothetical protein
MRLMQVVLEAVVVLGFSSIAAAGLTAALGFVQEREWPAVGFLVLLATTTITYGMMILSIVQGVFARL